MSNSDRPAKIPADNPIRKPEDDLLQRRGAAEAFARHVLALDASEGAAVSVFGPWGSGKTSFVNLARKTLEGEGATILDFNPWLFSGAEQLVRRFFAELSAQMKEKAGLENIVTAITKYGDALSGPAESLASLLGGPLAGQITSVLVKAIGDIGHPPEGVNPLRATVVSALKDRDKPIIVVLDDVDRLSGPEIQEIFKLVRLTASFPNLVYILPCDRLRIERALDEKEQALSGRDYMEKIIQWSFNLPEAPRHLLAQQLDAAIDSALAAIENPGPFDEDAWCDIRPEIVRPLIRNMRDVRRYALAIRETVAGLEGRVALADVLALEAVRVFLPDVFRLLPGTIASLTGMSQTAERRFDIMVQHPPDDPISGFNPWLKVRIDGLIDAAGSGGDSVAGRTATEVVEAMIDRLFPVGAQLRQTGSRDSDSCVNKDADERLAERRVAHEQVLRLYLERMAGPGLLAFHDAERALAHMAYGKRLNDFMRSLDQARWQDVVSNLSHLADRFRPEHAEPGVLVLLNLWPDMPERSSPPATLADTRAIILNASYRLLSVLGDAAATEAAVRRILPDITSLSRQGGVGSHDRASGKIRAQARLQDACAGVRDDGARRDTLRVRRLPRQGA